MKTFLFFYIILFLYSFSLLADGTKQIMPNSAAPVNLMIYDDNDANKNFMGYGCPATKRLNIRVKSVGNERIHIGIKQTSGDVWMRIRDPFGTLVYGPVLVQASMGAGWVNTYTQAVAGPSLVVGATGYNSLYFTPSLPGD